MARQGWTETKHLRQVTFQRWEDGQSKEWTEVWEFTVEVDREAILDELARSAIRNRSRVSKDCHGAVQVHAVRMVRREGRT